MVLIRAFGHQEMAMKKNIQLVNEVRLARFMNRAAYNYYDTRLSSIANIMFISVGITCINLKGTMSPIFLALMF
jgi:hypothetical protein